MSEIIKVEKLSKKIKSKEILKNINLSINEGEIYGLLGPSGCGKTTTIKTMCGLEKFNEGQIIIDNLKVPSLKILDKIGYMSQSSALYTSLTGLENMQFFGQLYGLKHQELQNRIDYLANLVDLNKDLDKVVSAYSGGMQQRLSLAIALIAKPKILMLDEPTVGIDPLLRKEIWSELKRLKNEGVTIIITTHVMDEALKCDRISMMREGQVISSGTPQQIMQQANTNDIESAFIYFSKGGSDNEN